MMRTFVLVLILVVVLFTGINMVDAAEKLPVPTVTIIEYIDFQCPDCAKAKTVIDRVLEKYHGQVQLELKQHPLPRHSEALAAAHAYLALKNIDESLAWQFYNLALTEQDVLKNGDIGLEYLLDQVPLTENERKELQKALNDPALDEQIQTDIAEETRLGLHGTPVFLINGQPVVPGDQVEDFTVLLDPLL